MVVVRSFERVNNRHEQRILFALKLRQLVERNEARMRFLLRVLHFAVAPAVSELLTRPSVMLRRRRSVRIIEAELNACPDVTRSVVFLKPGATQLTCVVDLANPQDEKAMAKVKKFAAGMRSTRTAFQHIEVILADEPFSVENGMLRPNMKVDRRAIAAKYG